MGSTNSSARGLGFRVLGFTVWGLGLRVSGLGSRVEGPHRLTSPDPKLSFKTWVLFGAWCLQSLGFEVQHVGRRPPCDDPKIETLNSYLESSGSIYR